MGTSGSTSARARRLQSGRDLQDVVPAFPVRGALDEGCSFGCVGRAEILVVPLDLLARAKRDIAEVIRLGRPAGILEVRAGHGTVALGIIDPFDPVTGRAGEGLGRDLE